MIKKITKLFMVMSRTAFSIILVNMCLAGSLIASNSNGQTKSMEQIYISLHAENESLELVLSEIKSLTEFGFSYYSDDISGKIVTIHARQESLTRVLESISKQTNLSFKRINDNINIYLPNDQAVVEEVYSKPNQAVVVTGTVTSQEDGMGLPGVNVIIKGSAQGAVTDLNGHYAVEVGSPEEILVFSYVGFLSEEVLVGSRTVIDISLVPDIKSLTEVVVTALGIEKESKSLSYHVQQLSGEEINNVKDANFVNSLAGKIAGVTINSSSTGVGGSSRVIMRGVKSITGNNNALYVIDGIPMPNLSSDQPADIFSGAGQTGDGISNLNPDDIESISVLSGPAAAALYGSSAANGVVLITTKRGMKETLSIELSNNTQFSSPLILPEFQNTYGQSETGSYYSWGDKLTSPSIYNPADFFQTGVNITNSASLSTGTENSQTYVSLGSVNSQGIVHNNNYERYNFSVRNTSNLNEKLTMDISFMSSIVKEQNMTAQGQYFNPLVPVYLFPAGEDFTKTQVYERYNASRNFKTQYWPYGDQGLAIQNPYWVTERNMFLNNKERYMTTASLKYELAPWANLSGRVKMDKNNSRYEKKFSASTNTLFASENGYYSLNDEETRQVYGEALLNINKTFNQNISFTSNIGSSFEDIRINQDMYGGKLKDVANLFSYGNIDKDIADWPTQSAPRKIKQSLLGSVQLGYKGMAYLDVTARNDWPSTLAGSNTESFFYPSVGLSGLITEMLNFSGDFIPYMKLRVSYAEVGNEPVWFRTISTYPLAGGSPVTQTRMPNPNLQPERTKSWEAGINLGLFKNKLKVDATVYQSSTYNQFFEPTLPASSGFTSVIVNAGQVDNKGIEVNARYSDKIGKLDWSSYIAYSFNRNEIVELLKDWENPVTGEIISLSELDMGGTGSYKMVLKEGGSMGDIYVNTLRTDEHGAIYVHPTDYVVVPDANNFVFAGNSNPKFNLGWGNNVSWDRLSVGVLFTGRVGGIVVSNTQAIMDAFGASKASADARDAGGALVNGKRIPAKEYYQTVGGGASGGIGSMYCYSATNVRLSELTIGYDVPVATVGNWIKGLNVSFIGRNLLLLHNQAPYDPELTANTGTYFQGVDYFMLPSLRNLGFSVKFKF